LSRVLLEQGAHPFGKTERGDCRALDGIVWSYCRTVSRESKLDAFFLEKGKQNVKEINEIFELVVDHALEKKELNTPDNHNIMLHCAVSIGHLKKVKQLVELGADVNFKGLDFSYKTVQLRALIGNAPMLYIAYVNGHKQVVKYLLEQDDIDVLQSADMRDLEKPENKVSSENLFTLAIKNDDVELLKEAPGNKAIKKILESADDQEDPLLINACEKRAFAVAEYLLELGADPSQVVIVEDERHSNNDDASIVEVMLTPLFGMYSISIIYNEGQLSLLLNMIEKAKNPDVCTKDTGLLLNFAIDLDFVIKYWFRNDSRNFKEHDFRKNSQAVRDKLLECGANVLAKDSNGLRPIDCAVKAWDKVVIEHWLDKLDSLYVASEDQQQEDVDAQKQKDLDKVLRAAKSKGKSEDALVERLEKAGAKSDKVQEKVEKAPENVLKPPVGNEFGAGQDYNNNNNF